ncbi:E3 ubiquitin-protein ligase [Morus notabilis]|uniref:U-box domain-containing protein n=1 Tax=Morus notabilis TaxID=981085 RepID=W9QKV1_9ROSA|nr:E3 ubiquitin-protein ligase PUB24 [Morus notabilis]EXB39655.1 E3 ubiquitin-protein ligase [Morus notabilis]
MSEIDEVRKYFLCPISLQIMNDPVTAVTGITYDRESIEKWLSTAAAGDATTITCPVTMQPLPRDSDLTPNHTLRRLIQAWCIAKGIDRIPTPKPPLDKRHVLKLLRDLRVSDNCRNIDGGLQQITTLKKIEGLAAESERNRRCMAEGGVMQAMICFVVRCFKEGKIVGAEEALRILHLVWVDPSTNNEEVKTLVSENNEFFESLACILGFPRMDNDVDLKSEAMKVLKLVIEASNSSRLERLRLELFMNITKILRESSSLSQQAIKSALQILIEACPWGRNRIKIIESGAVFDLIELELTSKPDRHTTEMIFTLLAHLCTCADGRAQFLQHAGGIAMVSKRILRVSVATDDRAIHVLSLIAKFSAKSEVLVEMLKLGAVTKLCMVMQADCAMFLKDKAKEILRLHSKVWNNSPCIAVYLLSRQLR